MLTYILPLITPNQPVRQGKMRQSVDNSYIFIDKFEAVTIKLLIHMYYVISLRRFEIISQPISQHNFTEFFSKNLHCTYNIALINN